MFDDVNIITAIVTPFDKNDQIDFSALSNLTEHLLDTGSDGFIIGGTTGETPTLTTAEKLELYTRFAQIVNHRAVVIAGTGSNNTSETITFTQKVAQIPGIDAALVVVPYYSKTDQRGLLAHFTAVATSSELPIMIYNIPGRTGIQMANDTVVKLSQQANVIGIKQCTTTDDLAYLVNHTTSDFAVYTGEDSQALPALALGANGVISVASHIYGNQMAQMIREFNQGHHAIAAQIQRNLIPKMNALFMYPSPTPVKAILNQIGLPVGGTRLPIVPLGPEEEQHLAQALAVSSLADLKEE